MRYINPCKYIVSVSSGAASAIAAERVINLYPRQNVELVFMDTLWEDEDNYRFLDDLEKRWGRKITRIVEGRTPTQVGSDENFIPNQRFGICTPRLKISPFIKYCEMWKNYGWNVTVALGLSIAEKHRMKAPKKNYEARGYNVIYPLMWNKPVVDPLGIVRSWGIEPPRMYKMGYSHANCGGRCLKQGQRDWKRTMENFPDRFEEVMNWEKEMRTRPAIGNFAILRDQRGGTVTPKTLESLMNENVVKQLELFDWSILTDETNCFCNASDPGPVLDQEKSCEMIA